MGSFRLVAVMAAALTFGAGPAMAADKPNEKVAKALADASAAVDRGAWLAAAGLFGDAIAITQKDEDIESEQVAADATVRFVDRAVSQLAANAGKKTDDPTLRTVLAGILAKLDPARCGAYVSAPVLARNVLFLSTEDADFRTVAEAAQVTAVHRAKAPSGGAAAVVARYGDGLTSVAAGAFEGAAQTLDAVTADATKSHWLDLAAHAGTEAAAAWIRAGKPEKATASVASVARAIEAAGSVDVRVREWNRYAARRLADAPAEVRKPLSDLVAKGSGGTSSTGAGAAGGSPTARGASAVGRLLSHLAKGRPFVSVECSAKGWQVVWKTKKSDPTAAAFSASVQTVDEGGIALCLADRSVVLRSIDYAGTAGQTNDNAVSPVRALYLVGEGETWSVATDGEVSITRTR